MNFSYILGERDGMETLTVMLNGHTHTIDNSNPQFDIALTALESNDLEALEDALDLRKTIVKQSMGKLVMDGKNILYNGEQLDHSLVNRIISMFSKGMNVEPLLAFLNNLLENPSYRAVNELYGFLNACSLPITGDGHFMAYKKVRSDYLDIYTGKMDNSVGKTVSMERRNVNEDCEQTCSAGLHVCSESYLSCYGSCSGNRVVLVKINPRDVVAVPTDYNNAKMRVCKYEVVGEMDEYEDTLDDDFTTDYDSDDYDSDDYEDDYEDDLQDGFDEIDEALENPTDSESEDSGELSDDEFNDLLDDWDAELDALDADEKFDNGMGETFEDTLEEMVDNTGEQLELELPETPRPTSTKLTETDVWDILSEGKEGWTLVASSKAHNVSPRQIGRIRQGQAWSDIYRKFHSYR